MRQNVLFPFPSTYSSFASTFSSYSLLNVTDIILSKYHYLLTITVVTICTELIAWVAFTLEGSKVILADLRTVVSISCTFVNIYNKDYNNKNYTEITDLIYLFHEDFSSLVETDKTNLCNLCVYSSPLLLKIPFPLQASRITN